MSLKLVLQSWHLWSQIRARHLLYCRNTPVFLDDKRVTTFHSRMAALQVSTCTCMERFPGMTVRVTPAGTVTYKCRT